MNVYILEADANRYQKLFPENNKAWKEEFDQFDGIPMGESWAPVSVKVLYDKSHKGRPSSDFPSLIPYIPVFSHRAVEVLADLLKENGELLPLNCNEGQYFAYNVTRLADALDTEQSELKHFKNSGRIMRVIRHVFHFDTLVDIHIFKLPQPQRSQVFVTDNFVQRVQESGLTGFDFKQVWTGPDNQ